MYSSYRWNNMGQSGPGSKSNEGVLCTAQIFITGSSLTNAVECHTQEALPFLEVGAYPIAEDMDTVSVFKAQPTGQYFYQIIIIICLHIVIWFQVFQVIIWFQGTDNNNPL